jgi:hypothetical protein
VFEDLGERLNRHDSHPRSNVPSLICSVINEAMKDDREYLGEFVRCSALRKSIKLAKNESKSGNMILSPVCWQDIDTKAWMPFRTPSIVVALNPVCYAALALSLKTR